MTINEQYLWLLCLTKCECIVLYIKGDSIKKLIRLDVHQAFSILMKLLMLLNYVTIDYQTEQQLYFVCNSQLNNTGRDDFAFVSRLKNVVSLSFQMQFTIIIQKLNEHKTICNAMHLMRACWLIVYLILNWTKVSRSFPDAPWCRVSERQAFDVFVNIFSYLHERVKALKLRPILSSCET